MLSEDDRKNIGDRALLDHHAAVHIGFAESQRGIDEDGEGRVRSSYCGRIAFASVQQFCRTRGIELHVVGQHWHERAVSRSFSYADE